MSHINEALLGSKQGDTSADFESFHRFLIALVIGLCCSMLQYVAVCCSVLQFVSVCCSMSQCVVVRCSVLQCVAVCCSALQPVLHGSYHPTQYRHATKSQPTPQARVLQSYPHYATIGLVLHMCLFVVIRYSLVLHMCLFVVIRYSLVLHLSLWSLDTTYPRYRRNI